MPRTSSVRDNIAQIRDDNLRLVLAPQAYVMLAEREREADLDARMALVLMLIFGGLMIGAFMAEPWTWIGWPGWSRVASFLLGLIGLPAAIGTWYDTRADRAEVMAETAALDRFLTAYDRDPVQARAEGLRQAGA